MMKDKYLFMAICIDVIYKNKVTTATLSRKTGYTYDSVEKLKKYLIKNNIITLDKVLTFTDKGKEIAELNNKMLLHLPYEVINV